MSFSHIFPIVKRRSKTRTVSNEFCRNWVGWKRKFQLFSSLKTLSRRFAISRFRPGFKDNILFPSHFVKKKLKFVARNFTNLIRLYKLKQDLQGSRSSHIVLCLQRSLFLFAKIFHHSLQFSK